MWHVQHINMYVCFAQRICNHSFVEASKPWRLVVLVIIPSHLYTNAACAYANLRKLLVLEDPQT